MGKRQLVGVKQLAFIIEFSVAFAIKGVTDDRMANVIQVNPDLMGPPGEQAARNEGIGFLITLLDMEIRHRLAPVGRVDGEFRWVDRIPADRGIDLSIVFINCSFD